MPSGEVYSQRIVYEWMHVKCPFCNTWGHEVQRCGKKIAAEGANAIPTDPGVHEAECSGNTELAHPSPARDLVDDQEVEEAIHQLIVEKHSQLGKQKEVIESLDDSTKKLSEDLQYKKVNIQGVEEVGVEKLSKRQRKKKKKQQQGSTTGLVEFVSINGVSGQQSEQLNVRVGEVSLEVSISVVFPQPHDPGGNSNNPAALT